MNTTKLVILGGAAIDLVETEYRRRIDGVWCPGDRSATTRKRRALVRERERRIMSIIEKVMACEKRS